MAKIVAVMVTGKDAARRTLAYRSIASFHEQVFPDRLLLVINDSEHPLITGDYRSSSIQEHMIAPPRYGKHGRRWSLGDLRNMGIEKAREAAGQLIVQWDDDDFSHPHRLSYQHEFTTADTATIFRWETHCNLASPAREAFANCGRISRVRGFAGTMMFSAHAPVMFPGLGKHEDTEFLLALREHMKLRVLDNQPTLYLRFYHGNNTWGEQHVMQRKPGSRDLTPTERAYLDSVLASHYDASR